MSAAAGCLTHYPRLPSPRSARTLWRGVYLRAAGTHRRPLLPDLDNRATARSVRAITSTSSRYEFYSDVSRRIKRWNIELPVSDPQPQTMGEELEVLAASPELALSSS